MEELSSLLGSKHEEVSSYSKNLFALELCKCRIFLLQVVLEFIRINLDVSKQLRQFYLYGNNQLSKVLE